MFRDEKTELEGSKETNTVKSKADNSIKQKQTGVTEQNFKTDNATTKPDAVKSKFSKDDYINKNRTYPTYTKLNPDATSYTPATKIQDQNMYGLLMSMIQQQAAPDVELECFDGNPLEYNHFVDLFTEVVEKWIPEPKGRLLRLLKYTKGEAHDLIKHCVQEPSYMGYNHAQQLLRKRYGDPHIILSTYRKEVRNWPKLKFGDAKGFRQFYNFLVKCEGVARDQGWNIINTPDILCMLVSKLPNGLIDRWNRVVYNIRKKQEHEPNLHDLIEFVDQETALVNDPLFSREALEGYTVKPDKKSKQRSVTSFATETSAAKCPFCSSKHDIEDCGDFKQLSVKERSKFFFKKKLCYGCCESNK